MLEVVIAFFFFFKQKTAYEMRISDWSSDVCSSDLPHDRADFGAFGTGGGEYGADRGVALPRHGAADGAGDQRLPPRHAVRERRGFGRRPDRAAGPQRQPDQLSQPLSGRAGAGAGARPGGEIGRAAGRERVWEEEEN